MTKSKTITSKVLERFGATGTHWSILEDDGEYQLCTLVSELFPLRHDLSIVEIGTHQGVSASVLAKFGIVNTYDVVDWPLRDEIIEHLGNSHRIEFKLIPTENGGKQLPGEPDRMNIIREGNEWLSAELRNKTFDIAFIDGNHEHESVVQNFESVKHCGVVVFHDYNKNQFHNHRTVRFVDSIPKNYGGNIRTNEPFAVWQYV